MGTPLRVLLLEDNLSDAELVLHALCQAGYDPISDRVETEAGYVDHLEPGIEIILADFTMPQFDSLRALEIMQERQLEIPFIIVSGTIGEERAVLAMQHGASDYVIKDRLGRLGPAVKLALSRQQLKDEKLKAEQNVARLAAIVETSGEAIFTTTLDGLINSWNRAAESLFGYTTQEILGQHFAVICPKGRRKTDAPEDQQVIAQILANGEHIAPFETVRVRKDGRRVEVLLSLSPIHDASGVVTGASAISLDITLRRRSERFLNAEQAITRILADSKSFESAGPRAMQTIAECLHCEVAGLWSVIPGSNALRRTHLWHSPWAAASFINALRQQAIVESSLGLAGRTWSTGEPVWDPCISLENLSAAENSVMIREEMRDGFGLPIRRGQDMVGVMEFYNSELREPDRSLLATLNNIATQISQFYERCRAEAALRASEEQYRQLADAMPQIVWAAQPDGRIDYFNERWYQLSGQSRDQDPEEIWRSAIHPDDLQRTQKAWTEAVRSGSPLEMEMRLIDHQTGLARWFLCRAIAATDASGTITRWHGTTTDVDDQRNHFEELQISEARFRNLVMALPAAVYTTDQNGLITLFNEHAFELWGRRPVLGKDRWCGSWKLVRLDGSPLSRDLCPMAVMLREGRAIPAEELIYERPDGSRVHVLNHPELLRGAAGEIVGAVGMLVDITQMKQLEEQYRQSQKMDAVGQLAAGVAHDFNNLLTIILGYSELFLQHLPETHPEREPIEQIRDAGERAAALTRQLLAFGRKQMLSPVVLDLNSLVTELDKMLRRLIGEDIEFCTILHPALSCMKADAGQVEQVIMNLVVNARDAMPTGGRLTLQTHDAVLSEFQLREHPDLSPGLYTMLTVSDTGNGMSEATMSRIFEPFFTTKETGKGTGLGLATVFGIVKQSGGFIEVESEPGSGSTFRVFFPQLNEALHINQADGKPNKPVRGKETILLVEDEDGLRKLAQMVLEAAGYKVLSTRNGNEAVRVCYEHQENIQLLFADVVMPKMSGRQLADILLPTRPDMKVLYMSGYTDDTMMRHGIQDEGVNFLPKPFTPAALTQKVREVLEATPPRSPMLRLLPALSPQSEAAV